MDKLVKVCGFCDYFRDRRGIAGSICVLRRKAISKISFTCNEYRESNDKPDKTPNYCPQLRREDGSGGRLMDNVKRIVDALRVDCENQDDCIDCERKDWCDEYDKLENAAADLIESLAAGLEQVTQERDGLSVTLTSAQSAAETHKRELDAALADMKAIAEKTGCCHCCEHQPEMNPDGSCDRFDPQNPGECWEWRGTYEKDRTLRADRADRTGTV